MRTRVSAAALVLALVVAPLVLDRCLTSCSAGSGQAASAGPACHHHAATRADGAWSRGTSCGHDHQPWSALVSVPGPAHFVSGLAILSSNTPPVFEARLVAAARSNSPPIRSSAPGFTRPLRV